MEVTSPSAHRQVDYFWLYLIFYRYHLCVWFEVDLVCVEMAPTLYYLSHCAGLHGIFIGLHYQTTLIGFSME